MTTLDEARRRHLGRHQPRQTFGFERVRALEQMGRFSLPSKEWYILKLVQAAVACRPNDTAPIHITMRELHAGFPCTTMISFAGRLPSQYLEDPLDYLFAHYGDPRLAAMYHLAMGLNALREDHAFLAIIESNDTRVELDADGVRSLKTGIGLDPMTMQQFGTSIRLRFSAPDNRVEYRLLNERCRYVPMPVTIDGKLLDRYVDVDDGSFHPRHATKLIHFDEEDLKGAVGVPLPSALKNAREGVVHLVDHGVFTSSEHLRFFDDREISGVVTCDYLRHTADGFGVVQDERFEDMRARVFLYAARVYSDGVGSPAMVGSALTLAGEERLTMKKLRQQVWRANNVVLLYQALQSDVDKFSAVFSGPILVAHTPEGRTLGRLVAGDKLIEVDDPEFYLRFLAIPQKRLRPDALLFPSLQPDTGDWRIEGGQVRLHAPRQKARARISLTILGRAVHETTLPTLLPLHVEVQLPLRSLQPRPEPLAGSAPDTIDSLDTYEGVIQKVAAALARNEHTIVDHAIARLTPESITPFTSASRWVLLYLGARTILTLREVADGVRLEPSLPAGSDEWLLDVPVVRSFRGPQLSFRELVSQLERDGVLSYTDMDQAKEYMPDGHSRTLLLTQEEVSLLQRALGSGALARDKSQWTPPTRARLPDGKSVPLSTLREAAGGHDVFMLDGWAIEATSEELVEDPGQVKEVSMQPYVLHVLRQEGITLRASISGSGSVDAFRLRREDLIFSMNLELPRARDLRQGVGFFGIRPDLEEPGMCLLVGVDGTRRAMGIGLPGAIVSFQDLPEAAFHSQRALRMLELTAIAIRTRILHTAAALSIYDRENGRVLLGWVLRHLAPYVEIEEDHHGRHFVAKDGLMEEILRFPLLPSVDGIPRSLQSLMRSPQNVRAQLHPSQQAELGPLLAPLFQKSTAHQFSHEDLVDSPPTITAVTRAPLDWCDGPDLAHRLCEWLHCLRKSIGKSPAHFVAVAICEKADDLAFARGAFGESADQKTLYLIPDDELFQKLQALARTHGPQAFAALLCSSYAYINERLIPVTNAHELAFQARLVDLALGTTTISK